MATDQLKSTIESPPQPDFDELMSWAIGQERRRRYAAPAASSPAPCVGLFSCPDRTVVGGYLPMKGVDHTWQ